jgi:hypothetical protein
MALYVILIEKRTRTKQLQHSSTRDSELLVIATAGLF